MAICATLDIETLSRQPDAAFDQLAMVFFDDTKPLPPLEIMIADGTAIQFDIHEDSYKELGLHIDPETLKWREEHGTPIARPMAGKGYGVRKALKDARKAVKKYKPTAIYLQGKDFDAPIIKTACAKLKIDLPWGDDYWLIKCSRDVIKWEFSEKTRIEDLTGSKNTHGALEDAYNQAKAMQIAIRHRRRKNFVYRPVAFFERLLGKV